MSSGYTYCACRDCFEIVVSDDMEHPDFCDDCIDAGCPDYQGMIQECQAPHAYGCGDYEDEEEPPAETFDEAAKRYWREQLDRSV